MFTSITLITALVTAAACAPLIAVLRRTGRHDVPNERSSHTTPTPRGGGIAVLAGAAVACAVVAPSASPPWNSAFWAPLGATAALAAVGFVDDIRGLAPITRLLTQVLVGALAGAALGGLTGAILGGIALPAAVNMINFMDGINGLCAGHAAVWGLGALLAARAGGGEVLGLLGAISLGGALGFLPWNAPRARLFMGDVGSYLFGALAGVGLVVGATRTGADADGSTVEIIGLLMAPYLLFALDTSTTMVRRMLAGESVFEPHRSHIYQQLANEASLPHWVVSLVMSTASLLVVGSVLVGPVPCVVVAALVGSGYVMAPSLAKSRLSA